MDSNNKKYSTLSSHMLNIIMYVFICKHSLFFSLSLFLSLVITLRERERNLTLNAARNI